MKQTYGAIRSRKDLRDYRINKTICSSVEVPEHYSLDPGTIRNQGAVCSCVAHSVASSLEHSRGLRLSTNWIYGYRPTFYYKGTGMRISDALKTVTNVGYIHHKDFPGNVEYPEVTDIVDKNIDKLKKLASEMKASKYARLQGIQEIKESILLSGRPAVLCIVIGKDGLCLNEYFEAELPNGSSGCHAVLCYGWNPVGLLIQNSWGSRWGKDGCFVLPYEYGIREAWSIDVAESPVIVKPTGFKIREFIMTIVNFFVRLFKR